LLLASITFIIMDQEIMNTVGHTTVLEIVSVLER